MRLLIDECLSEELARMARRRGHGEASHVRWLGKTGAPDWRLMAVITQGDWTFVTRNAVDFRGPLRKTTSRGLYRALPIHAGLVCLNGPSSMDLALQIELFTIVLDELDGTPDLVNTVLEATLSNDGEAVDLTRYSLPE